MTLKDATEMITFNIIEGVFTAEMFKDMTSEELIAFAEKADRESLRYSEGAL